MDNKEILKAMHKRGEAGYGTAMELARQDEREKWRPHLLDSVLTDAEFKEYTGSEREKMQGVEVFVSWDSEDNELEIQKNRCSVWADRPWHDREFGTFNGGEDVAWLFNVDEDFCDMLGVDSGQCKKFRIVEEL